MEIDAVKSALGLANLLQDLGAPAEEVPRNVGAGPIPPSIVRGTRGYVEKVAFQVNEAYSRTCYDACLVMCRRLIETLVIEACEFHGLKSKIIGSDSNYLMLGDLIDVFLNESASPTTTWKLGRTCSTALPKLKKLGDRSAHDRRFNAHMHHVDNVRDDLVAVVQELTVMLGWK